MTEEEDPPAFKAARKKDKDRLQRLEDNGLLEHGLSVFFCPLATMMMMIGASSISHGI